MPKSTPWNPGKVCRECPWEGHIPKGTTAKCPDCGSADLGNAADRWRDETKLSARNQAAEGWPALWTKP